MICCWIGRASVANKLLYDTIRYGFKKNLPLLDLEMIYVKRAVSFSDTGAVTMNNAVWKKM
jgi:hypothetical protein